MLLVSKDLRLSSGDEASIQQGKPSPMTLLFTHVIVTKASFLGGFFGEKRQLKSMFARTQ